MPVGVRIPHCSAIQRVVILYPYTLLLYEWGLRVPYNRSRSSLCLEQGEMSQLIMYQEQSVCMWNPTRDNLITFVLHSLCKVVFL